MVRILLLCMVVCVFLVDVVKPDEAPPDKSAAAPKALHGLWRGSWGRSGREDDGVVYMGSVGELYIGSGRAASKGLPIPDGTGAIVLHSDGKRRWARFTYSVKEKGKPQQKPVDFSCEIRGDELTITIGDEGGSFSLTRVTVKETPFADINVDFEMARGVDGEGNLLATKFSAIRVGDRGPELPSRVSFARPLRNAHIYRVEENGAKKTTVEEVRRLLREPAPVVIASRSARNGTPMVDWRLSKKLGTLHPDSEAGLKTLTRLLKPGTLVFVVPEAERVPIP